MSEMNDILKKIEELTSKARKHIEETETGFAALNEQAVSAGKLYVYKNMHDKQGYNISLMPAGSTDLIDLVMIEDDGNGNLKIAVWSDPATENVTDVIGISKEKLADARKTYGDEIDYNARPLPKNFFTWKDIVCINGKVYCEEFPISGKSLYIDKYNITYSNDTEASEFLEIVAKMHNVPVSNIKTWLLDNVSAFVGSNFDTMYKSGRLAWNLNDCGICANGIPLYEFTDQHEDFVYIGENINDTGDNE